MSRPSARRQPLLQRVLVYLLVVAITIITVYPIIVVINVSIRPNDALYTTSLSLVPDAPTLEAYRTILFDRGFLLWMRNSLIVATAVTIFGVALASTAAYGISRFDFPGRKPAMVALLITQMFPATMLLLPLYVLMRHLHLVDSLIGLIIAYTATVLPFTVWTLKGYYDTIPRDLEEAALVDGTNHVGAFVRVVLPLARPALMITGLFSFMSGWSEFIVARVILSSQGLYTLPLGLEGLAGTFQTEWANYSAGSLLVCIPVVALFLILNRFLVSGLTLGGVKG